ncbi:hypothetical protein K445DRAFT_282173 [Daldinia sp. EC12]|nr:hypothetical protein K445DRAFT_282173 [Daldinia sp. EC12]
MAAQPMNEDVVMVTGEETRPASAATPSRSNDQNNKQKKRRQPKNAEHNETIEALFKRLIDMVKENYKEKAIEVKTQITDEINKALETETRKTLNR